MEKLDLMERFSDPKLFEQLTVGEKITGALITTLMGMGITFAVLILLWGVIALMTKILTQKQQSTPQSSPSTGKSQEVNVVSQVSAEVPSKGSQELNPELVAVLMAAIAAGESKDFVNRLVIRKINRISGDVPVWGMAGARDAIDSRKI